MVVYTIAKSPLVENIVHERENDMDANIADIVQKGSSPEVKFRGQPQSFIQET